MPSGTVRPTCRGRPTVDQEQLVVEQAEATGGFGAGFDLTGTPVEKWADKEWIEFGVESQNWTLSQFLHGEQGALICTAKIVESVPWIDAKYYASTQVMDEARHVEVFAKYLDEQAVGPLPDQRPPAACCSTTSSPTPAGT